MSLRPPPFIRSTRFLIMALVAVGIAALLSVVGLSAASIQQMALDEDREVEDGLALIESAHGLKSAAINQVLLVRDYLLTGKPVFLDPRARAAAVFEERVAAFHKLPVDPRDHELLAEILRLGRRFGLLEQQAIALRRDGRERDAVDLLALEGGATKEVWLARLDELIARQRGHVGVLHARVNETERRIQLLLLILALVTVPTTILLGAAVLLRVIRPLRELEAASRAIAAGHLAVRLGVPGQPRRDDEFGEVSEAFNHMASEVERSLTRLTAANEALRTADRHKDEFLSVVSHELRTPLSFIKGFANVLEAELAGPLTGEQRQYVRNITTGANRMLYLVNDLLDLALLQAGKLRLSPALVQPAEIVAEVLGTLGPLADEKRLALDSEPAEPLALVADRQRVAQVLTNLIANAIKFTPPQGRINVRVRAEGEGLRFEVADSGPGISVEDQAKLFQRFTQLDMSSTRAAGGTGLGLSISKALVDAHEGTIGVESELGSGATFWFWLPTQPPAGTAALALA